MKRLGLLVACGVWAGLAGAQVPAAPTKLVLTTDDAGQRVAFAIPRAWRFRGGVLTDGQGRKVGELAPGTLPGCPYASGAAYLAELRAGYPDDVGDPRFVGSQTLVLANATWTEGVRNVPAWDGARNAGRWYAHSFFARLGKQCFALTFYSPQRQLPGEDTYRKILASIKLL